MKTYLAGAEVLGHGGGGHGGHGGGHGGHGGHGSHGGGGRVFGPRLFGPGWWGDDWIDVPEGYIYIDDVDEDECDLVGPNGECYIRVESVLGYDSSTHSTTLRDSPIQDQVYGLQVAAAKTGSPSLIQAAKDLQTALSSWWANFSTSGIKDRAAELGKAIAKWSGSDPLDGPPIHYGVSSGEQEQLFDQGATGKLELQMKDVSMSAQERAQEVSDAASSAKKYVEKTANKANTTLIVVGVAAGLLALAVIGTTAYRAVK